MTSAEYTPAQYKAETRMRVVAKPYANSIVLATRPNGFPEVLVMPVPGRNYEKWIVTNHPTGRTGMFKDDGLFGISNDKDEIENDMLFDTLQEAVDTFYRFYGHDPSKPREVEDGEWELQGCTIQENDHPKLSKYSAWNNNGHERDTFGTFKEAVEWCNEINSAHQLTHVLQRI